MDAARNGWWNVFSVCIVLIYDTWTLKTEPVEWISAAAGMIHTCTFPTLNLLSGGTRLIVREQAAAPAWLTHWSCWQTPSSLLAMTCSHNFTSAEAACYRYLCSHTAHWMLFSNRQRWQSSDIGGKKPFIKQDISCSFSKIKEVLRIIWTELTRVLAKGFFFGPPVRYYHPELWLQNL